MAYPALLPLMRIPRLSVVDWTDSPADWNGLIRFAERRNLVSARVPSHFKSSLQTGAPRQRTIQRTFIFGTFELLCDHAQNMLAIIFKIP